MHRLCWALLAGVLLSSAGCYATVRPGYREPNGEWREHERGREFDDRDHDDGRDHDHDHHHDRD